MTGRAGTTTRVGTAVAAAAVVAAVVGAAALATVPGSGAVGASMRGGDASRPVGVRVETFVDRGRSTPADPRAGITPAKKRVLETTIYYPARGRSAPDGAPKAGARPAGGTYPLVLFSHGSPGAPEDYEVLLADWAAHGYVVAAARYPISSLAGPDAVAWKDLPAQSKDARFVLDEMLDLDPDDAGIPEIDDDRIAVAGHSFGAATTLSLVSRCCRDDRIDAAVALAGVVETVSGPRLRNIRGPVLFVHARGDSSVRYRPAVRTCEAAGTPKRLVTVEEIRGLRAHVNPYLANDEYAAVVRPAIVDFLDGYLRDREAARTRLDRAGEGTTVAAATRCRPGAAPTTPSV